MLRKILWFFALWVAGVGAVALVVYGVKLVPAP